MPNAASEAPKPFRRPAVERFFDKVKIEGDCHVWMGSRHGKGYGHFKAKHGNKTEKAHRFAYETWRGPIPSHLQIDHLCRNKACVNPWHLECVSVQENIRRRPPIGEKHRNTRKTHCAKGHEYSPENTRVNAKGHRFCKTCKAEWDRGYMSRRKSCVI